ncbi:MAG: transporter substrate-binding domain-containing protein [Paracoccaceae bacterium]
MAQSANPPLVLSNATLPPVTNQSGDGYLNLVLNEMFARTGLAYTLEAAPPERGLFYVAAGQFDGEAARAEIVSESFPDLIKLSEPIIDVAFAGLMKHERYRISSWQDLSDLRVGYIRGWKIFDSILENHRDVARVRNADILLNMLKHDRIDVALITVVPGRQLAQEKGMGHLFATEARLTVNLFMYLNKKHADKAEKLNNALIAMKADGRYDEIMAGYVLASE